ncbi:MAG TPA: hypothetical protein VMD30_01645 [Tepidisphaeraceae bacterium]|nr:hypothetical protein [Tepidisphaeraceae bacterium]
MTLSRYWLLVSLADGPSFLGGNWAYNLLNLASAIIGFGFTLWQLYKTRKAADAARDSARQTVRGFHGLAALVDFSNLEKWAEGIILYVEGRDFGTAMIRLLDLQNGLARARESAGAERLLSKDEWSDLINNVAAVDSAISSMTTPEATIDAQLISYCRIAMVDVSKKLNGLAARAIKAVEPKPEKQDANS